MARSDRFTVERAKREVYSDFTINFDRNPVTGLLQRLTNEDSVRAAVRNLVMTNKFERPYQPHLGSKAQSLLFEPSGPDVVSQLSATVRETIENFEPRVRNLSVAVEAQEDPDTVRVSVVFSVGASPELTSANFLVTRPR